MVANVIIQKFPEDLAKKVHNLSADALKVMLVNSPAPVNTNTVKADLTEITPANGYAAGGGAPTISGCAQTSGTLKLTLADYTFTGSGGSFGPFRYVVLYNDTPAATPTDPLICFWDYGSSISVNDTETFKVDFDDANGVLTIG